MAVAKIQKINVVGIQKDREKILKRLQELNCIEVIEPNKKLLARILGENVYFAGKEQMEFDIAELKFAIDFLARYDEKNKPGFIQGFMGDLVKLNKSEFEKRCQFDYESLVGNIKQIESQILESERHMEKNNHELDLLREWQNLTIPISQLKSLASYQFILGSVSADKWDNLLQKLSSITKLVTIEKVRSAEESKFQKLLLIYPGKPEELEKKINQLLGELNFQVAESLTKYEGKIFDEMQNLKKENIKLRQDKKELEAKIKSYIPKKLDLMCVYEFLSWQENLAETQKKTISTKYTFILTAWVRADQLEITRKELFKITPNIFFKILNREKEEQVPVVLKNSQFIQPFETVTNIYGMPKYDEPDPTIWLAPFFILFFALCLTDAGYGLIIIILTYFMLKKWNYPLIRLLNYAGWATLVIGALTGGWFGLDLDTLQLTWLASILKSIRIVDPVKNPMAIIILALTLGVMQICFGLFCKMYWNLTTGKIKDALMEQLPWLYLLVVIIGFGLAKMGILPLAQLGIWKILLYIGLATVVITQGIKEKNILLKLPLGLLALYGLVGFLSDTLSYTRLLALGLATSIIAMVINMVASLTKGIPIIGILIFIIILLGGHTFNIAINTLGAFIHSARLQYVEFFSKFLEGGGRRFKPFCQKHTYVDIK